MEHSKARLFPLAELKTRRQLKKSTPLGCYFAEYRTFKRGTTLFFFSFDAKLSDLQHLNVHTTLAAHVIHSGEKSQMKQNKQTANQIPNSI